MYQKESNAQSFGKRFDRFCGSICHSNMHCSVCSKVHRNRYFFFTIFPVGTDSRKNTAAVRCGVTFVRRARGTARYEWERRRGGKKTKLDSSAVANGGKARKKRIFVHHSPPSNPPPSTLCASSVARAAAIIPRTSAFTIHVYLCYVRTHMYTCVRAKSAWHASTRHRTDMDGPGTRAKRGRCGLFWTISFQSRLCDTRATGSGEGSSRAHHVNPIRRVARRNV